MTHQEILARAARMWVSRDYADIEWRSGGKARLYLDTAGLIRAARRGGWQGAGTTGYQTRYLWAPITGGDAMSDKKDMPGRVALETTGYLKGRIVIDEELHRVRLDEESWREPKPGADIDEVRRWLSDRNYKLEHLVPSGTIGTGTIRYFFVAP